MTNPTTSADPKRMEKAKRLPGTDAGLDSVSEIDQELLVGERRESDWRDARKESVSSQKPTLEDGAD